MVLIFIVLSANKYILYFISNFYIVDWDQVYTHNLAIIVRRNERGDEKRQDNTLNKSTSVLIGSVLTWNQYHFLSVRFDSVRDWGVLDTTLRNIVCQWVASGRWFSPDTHVASSNGTDHHNTTEIVCWKWR